MGIEWKSIAKKYRRLFKAELKGSRWQYEKRLEAVKRALKAERRIKELEGGK